MDRLSDLLRQAFDTSAVLRLLLIGIPVSITVAAIAGWRKTVPGARGLALSGALLLIWLSLPVRFALLELRQLAQMLSILGWVWLLWAWVKHVLGDWPSPTWGHWLVGTLLCALPFVLVVAILPHL
jgi:hypothetical protein